MHEPEENVHQFGNHFDEIRIYTKKIQRQEDFSGRAIYRYMRGSSPIS